MKLNVDRTKFVRAECCCVTRLTANALRSVAWAWVGIVWRTARRGGEIREGKLQRNLHNDALCCGLVPVSMFQGFQEQRERH